VREKEGGGVRSRGKGGGKGRLMEKRERGIIERG
jgi:hypothetical protein